VGGALRSSHGRAGEIEGGILAELRKGVYRLGLAAELRY
jgi:hypothetical protein